MTPKVRTETRCRKTSPIVVIHYHNCRHRPHYHCYICVLAPSINIKITFKFVNLVMEYDSFSVHSGGSSLPNPDP